MKSTTIPVEGDRNYVKALSTFAKTKNKTMSTLVRDALNTIYGDELQPFIELFVANDGAQIVHSDERKSERGEASHAA